MDVAGWRGVGRAVVADVVPAVAAAVVMVLGSGPAARGEVPPRRPLDPLAYVLMGVAAAVLLAAMIIHGVQPGPMLMVNQPQFVYDVVAMVLFSTLGILFFGLFFIKPLLKITQVPRSIMMPIIFVLCVIGSYSLSSRLFDVYTGPQIGEGKKSLAYALRFRAPDRTLTDAEAAAARRLIAEIACARPQRSSRRLRPHRRGRTLDVRRLARDSLATGGDPLQRRFRRRVQSPRKLVVLCDVSGSMEAYSRAMLLYLHALMRSGRGVDREGCQCPGGSTPEKPAAVRIGVATTTRAGPSIGTRSGWTTRRR
jgi:hypothetical protein